MKIGGDWWRKKQSKNSMDSNVKTHLNVPQSFPPQSFPTSEVRILCSSATFFSISVTTPQGRFAEEELRRKTPEITKTNSPAAFASFRKMSWELKEKLLYHTFVKGFFCPRCQHESIQVILKGYHMVQCLRCETASHQASGRLCEYRNSLSKMGPGS